MQRSMRWALRATIIISQIRVGGAPAGSSVRHRAGGMYESLRLESIETLAQREFPGYAVGGLAVGEPEEERLRVLDFLTPRLRSPAPLSDGVAIRRTSSPRGSGIDMFDCVMPPART